MSIDAWLFLVSRNRYFDYRTVVSPDFMVEAKASGLLAKVSDGDLTNENSAIYREIYDSRVGELTLIFRIVEATGADVKLDTKESLKDPYGRSILLVEGVVIRGVAPRLEITLRDFENIHKRVMENYQEFWKCTHSPSVIQSNSFLWQTGEYHEQPMELFVMKPVGSKPSTQPVQSLSWEFAQAFHTKRRIAHVTFDPSNALVASRSDSQLIQVWQLSRGREVATNFGDELPLIYRSSSSVAFSPDGILIATGYIERSKFDIIDRNIVKVWNRITKENVVSFHEHQVSESGRIRTVCFSPDGQTIASAGKDRIIKVWDVPGKGERISLEGHSSIITSIAISPDGKTLISGDMKGFVNIWNINSGRLVRSIEAHTLSAISVSYSPCSGLFASSSADATIKLWEVSTGQLLCTLSGHEDKVNSVAFGADGRTLASASDDRTVRIWNVEYPSNPVVLDNRLDALSSVAFSPDGQLLASGGVDGIVKIWRYR
jgi:WD40 repeat protein